MPIRHSNERKTISKPINQRVASEISIEKGELLELDQRYGDQIRSELKGCNNQSKQQSMAVLQASSMRITKDSIRFFLLESNQNMLPRHIRRAGGKTLSSNEITVRVITVRNIVYKMHGLIGQSLNLNMYIFTKKNLHLARL